ncbi:cyclic nucleotide-binding domain-containing protein [Candidatus Peregrinibacteria bacterium]|jgi:CRP-like cAMP-binding protein|nr:cyclic nucleotide-binding domain-containing protein [Candidatus Peregrinibacteria bacterium]
MNTETICTLARQQEFFEEFNDEEIKYLCETVGKPHPLPKGRVLFEERDHGSEMFFILAGRIQITVNGKILTLLNEGDIAGEIALLLGDGHRTASGKVTRNAQVWSISSANLEKISSERSEIAYKLMKQIAKNGAKKLKRANLKTLQQQA